ncbi:alpha/beta hydrolase-fold protein [Jutongia sp.]|uniref:alpha/beta hydrolase-fold protein n=1 Tax=Jutongia sp. TaxID=2944204 RepID=UPI00307AAA82
MKKESFVIGQKQCVIYHDDKPEYILLQPVNDHEMENLDRQVSLIKAEVSESFMFVAFLVERWNQELSPWNALPVFGQESFGEGAGETLRFISEKLIPLTTEQYASGSSLPVILGGYSLAGLFALWSAGQTEEFSAVAAVSPSVWFPGWSDYAQEHKLKTERIYLSLGRKEEKTRNKIMAAVGDCIREQHKRLVEDGIVSVLEWNEGNHFQKSDLRCAKGFVWCVRNIVHI